MQDKEKSGLSNEEFTDLGWSKMQPLLDREMPISAAPNRDYLLVLPVLLLILISFWGIRKGLENTGNTSATIPPIEAQKAPKSDAESEELRPTVSNVIANVAPENSTNQVETKPLVSATKITKSTPKAEKSTAFVIEENLAKNSNQKKYNEPIINSTDSHSPSNSFPKNIVIPIVKDIIEVPHLRSENARKNIDIRVAQKEDTTTIAPSRKPLVSQQKKVFEDLNALQTFSKRPKLSVKTSLYLGTSWEKFKRFNGLSFGALIDLNTRTRWSAETGILFTSASAEYQTPDLGYFGESRVIVHSLYYLEAPFLLSYQVTPRWKFSLGGDVSLAVARKDYESLLVSNVEFADMVSNAVEPTLTYMIAPQRLLDVGVQAAATYRLNHRFSLKAHYRRGLRRVYKDNLPQQRSAFGVGLLYQLGR